ncbi:HpcH/HpaI aldolase family protein [Nitratireductor luteus]|uniref:HpcH/HpaI aldolase family protein n=1 Tax=Nitratireductor luteus TaxID=2976980 RepID=UPI00223F5081|nr:HpcH/HpaI aldolase/citrate lyase family protein [Nitratireductor luteus]
MADRTLDQRMAAGEALLSAWSAIPEPLTTEAVARLGFDAVTLDMQHGGHSDESVLRAIPAIRTGGPHSIVRIPVGRFDMASRALDFGAECIIAPMVNTIEDARRFAAAMKYPPQGERSWGATIAMLRAGAEAGQDWLETQNARTLALAMIETREALAIVDDILAVDGIDGVFVGPSDFSIAWTNGASIDPSLEEMMEAIGTIAAKATAAGKHAAIYTVDPALVGRCYAMGYRLFALGNEYGYLTHGARSFIQKARDSLESNT